MGGILTGLVWLVIGVCSAGLVFVLWLFAPGRTRAALAAGTAPKPRNTLGQAAGAAVHGWVTYQPPTRTTVTTTTTTTRPAQPPAAAHRPADSTVTEPPADGRNDPDRPPPPTRKAPRMGLKFATPKPAEGRQANGTGTSNGKGAPTGGTVFESLPHLAAWLRDAPARLEDLARAFWARKAAAARKGLA